MKRTRRIEVISYRRRVTVVEGHGAITETPETTSEFPFIDIVPNEPCGKSPNEETGHRAAEVDAHLTPLRHRRRGWRKLLKLRS